MVTAGANQAYTNVVCALLDEDDKCVLFKPYYFNHLMCIQVSCFRSDSWIIKPAALRLPCASLWRSHCPADVARALSCPLLAADDWRLQR